MVVPASCLLLLSESNKWVTVWKLLVPTVTFILMFTAFKAENFHVHGGFAPMGWGAVFGAVAGGGIVFAYAGVRQIVDFGGEVINPRRNIPIAMVVGGVIIPLVLYLALQIGFIGALDWDAAKVQPGDWAGLMDSPWASAPLLEAVTVAGFAWFATVLLSDAALSPAAPAGCMSVWVVVPPTRCRSTGNCPASFSASTAGGCPGWRWSPAPSRASSCSCRCPAGMCSSAWSPPRWCSTT